MLTQLIQSLGDAGLALLSVLPGCPFYVMQNSVNNIVISSTVLSYLSWIVPFDAIVLLIFKWLQAIAIWYVCKQGLRWSRWIR